MSDAIPRWRSRRFVVLVILLLFGGPLAWRFRPLTPTERWLVGTWGWRNPEGPVFETITFRPDRTFTRLAVVERGWDNRFSAQPGQTGSWSSSFGSLSMRPERRGTWKSFVQWLRQLWNDRSARQMFALEFEGNDILRTEHRQMRIRTEYRRVSDPLLLEWAAEPKLRKVPWDQAPALVRQDRVPAPVTE